MTPKKIKYNMGAGPKRVDGFLSVDSLKWGQGLTDIIWDLTVVPYEFAEPDSADEILAIEFLEHISFRDTMKVLTEWYRILKPGGKVSIQVPDRGSMMKMYVNGEICDCVDHKQVAYDYIEPKDQNAFGRGKKECWNCGGKGRVNPNRWLLAFIGAQKHPFDIHRNIFTKERMEEYLKAVGFKDIKIKNDKFEWKIIANAIK